MGVRSLRARKRSVCGGIAVDAAIAAAVAVIAAAVAGCGGSAGRSAPPPGEAPAPVVLAGDEVLAIMRHAARATDRPIAVAVTDRNGTILGVGTNFATDASVLATSSCTDLDGSDCSVVNLAVQLARTAAFFSADQTPLTSRSVRFISDVHFPPGVMDTASAALFGIENTNRGCSFDAGGVGFIAGQEVPQPLNLRAALVARGGGAPLRCEAKDDANARAGCSRGIATFPGAVPIFKSEVQNGKGFVSMVGGVGVAVRGTRRVPDRFAQRLDRFDEPDSGVLRGSADDPNFDVAELAARAYAGDATGLPNVAAHGFESVCESTTIARPACCATTSCDFNVLPARRLPFDPVIFIDGIEVPEVAGNPAVDVAFNAGADLQTPLIVDPSAAGAAQGRPVPSGYLVGPMDSTPGAQPLSAEEVDAIIQSGVERALATRAAIRLPLEARTAMMLAVSDTNDKLLGLYRMPDATVFSIDVAVAKSRNVIYFSSSTIDPVDTLDTPAPGDVRGQAFPPGTAITNRTLSFGAQPFFPSGIDTTDPGPFRRIFLEDSARPCTNGREPANGRQNGIVFFPGSAPLYRDGVLIGGFGVSGDGVEQDDIVTNAGTEGDGGFKAPEGIRADQIEVRGVRLPYLKFNRRPGE